MTDDTLRKNIAVTLQDCLDETLRDSLQDALEDVKNEFSAELQDVVRDAIGEVMSELEFRLADGTVLTPCKKLKLLCADKSKQLLCYGGLKVERCQWNGGPDGYALWVQTRACSWDIAAHYPEKSDAIATLLTVRDAMRAGEEYMEL